jgi:hypothetical protein
VPVRWCRYDSSFPVYLSAVALQKLGHADGELNWSGSLHAVHRIARAPPLHLLPSVPPAHAASISHAALRHTFFAGVRALARAPAWHPKALARAAERARSVAHGEGA